MNILILVDKHKSAIDRLSHGIKRHNTHFNIKIVPLHPKRPNPIQVSDALEAWEWADLVHVSYWRSGEKFRELYPQRFKDKRKILWHHNPYDIDKKNWTKDYKRVVVHNKEMHAKIPYAVYIPQGINLNFFEFPKEYTDEKVVNMVAGRIEGKKGIKEVAQACYELDYKFILVGRISSRDYFRQIMEVNPDTDFREDITDEQLKESYYESAIHVCNSVDGFESGTMPILEAMATGVPVLTRSIGHVPDLFNGSNMVVRNGDTDDLEDLKKELKDLMENKAQRDKTRRKAFETIKNRPERKMARQFSRLYYDVMDEGSPLVSVIVPTYDRPNVLTKNLAKIVAQTYRQIEIIVVDSGDQSVRPIAQGFRKHLPVKYVRVENKGEYTLPKARNLGVVEAEGEYICLCDERIGMQKNAIEAFVEHPKRGQSWLYGEKDGTKKGFVENFSFVPRGTLIKYGVFNERIDCYGGASEEIRKRYGRHGVFFEFVKEAKADEIASSKERVEKLRDKIRAKFILWKLYG